MWEKDTVPQDDDEVEITINKTTVFTGKICAGVQDLQGDGWRGKRHSDVQRNPGSTTALMQH